MLRLLFPSRGPVFRAGSVTASSPSSTLVPLTWGPVRRVEEMGAAGGEAAAPQQALLSKWDPLDSES